MKTSNSLSNNNENDAFNNVIFALNLAIIALDLLIIVYLTLFGFHFASYSNRFKKAGIFLLLLDVIVFYLLIQVIRRKKAALEINIGFVILILPLVFPLFLFGTTS
jgi:hypothetical protein